jgi:hypothetical protein
MVAGAVLVVGAVAEIFGSHSGSASYKAGYDVGTAAVAVLGAWLFLWGLRHVRERDTQPTPAARGTKVALIALLVILGGGIVIGAIVGPRSAEASSWSSQQGIDARAGFIDACNQSAGARLDCGCVFDHLIAVPAYNTPAGFETLAGPIQQFEQTGDTSYIPAAYVAAVTACATPTP